MSHTRLPELIPVGGIVKIHVPAAIGADDGVLAMKLRDGTMLELFSVDHHPVFEVIEESLAHYPIVAYYGNFLDNVTVEGYANEKPEKRPVFYYK